MDEQIDPDDMDPMLNENDMDNLSTSSKRSNKNGCNCWRNNFGIIVFPIFPLGLLIFCECYRLVGIAQNRFFDEIYLIIYVILFGLLVAVFVYMIVLLFYERSV